MITDEQGGGGGEKENFSLSKATSSHDYLFVNVA